MTKHLYVGICNCHNSDRIARTRLKNGGLEEWATYPIAKGKSNVLLGLKELSLNGYNVSAIEEYVRNNSSFVVFVLYSSPDEEVHFRDASNGGATARLDAEAMVGAFAKNK